MSMKINSPFSSCTAATNSPKKENKPFRREDAEAGALSKKFDRLTTSGKGTEAYRKSVSEGGQSLTYSSVDRQKRILSSGIDYSYNLSKEADKLNKADEGGSTLSWQAKSDNLNKAYQKLRDEIVQGCENGTRQVNVIDESSETGYRTLTVEEELNALDAAYEKSVKGFEELSSQQEHAQEITAEWQEQIAAIKEGKISEQPAEEQEKAEDQSGSKGMVGINAGKLARMLAAAKTRSQVQAVMSKIQADLNECEAGKNQGMDVDENSVKAAKLLLEEAKSKMSSAENREPTPQEEMAAAIASLM